MYGARLTTDHRALDVGQHFNSRTGSLDRHVRLSRSGADLNTAQTITINSFVCSPVMTFRLSIASDGANGGVQMDEGSTSGLRIAYNC